MVAPFWSIFAGLALRPNQTIIIMKIQKSVLGISILIHSMAVLLESNSINTFFAMKMMILLIFISGYYVVNTLRF